MDRVLRALWALATPLAVAVLLVEPRSLAGPADEAAEHAEGAEHGEHHLITNPIQNMWSWGYRSLNAEGGPLEEGQHKMPPPFSMALLNFAAFAVLMGRMGAPSIAKAVRDRHDEIAKALSEGTRLRDQAKAKLDEYDRKLSGLQAEIDKLIGGIRAEAEAEKKRIIADAEARAVRMQKDAEQQIQAEIQRVRMTLEREAVQAAVAVAERMLAEKTTDADQRALADKFVTGLKDAAAKKRTVV